MAKQEMESRMMFAVGHRTYELVPFLKNGESSVEGDTMVERAKELSAYLGKEDGAFILEHQNEIPQEFRGKFHLVFTAWRAPSDPQNIHCLGWYDTRWYQSWAWLDGGWDEYARLLRRKT